MSSMPREALKTRASKPGLMGMPNSRERAEARAMSSGMSERIAGVILSTTSSAVKPSMRSAPTVEDLDDAAGVGGNGGEVGGVEDGALEGAGFQDEFVSTDSLVGLGRQGGSVLGQGSQKRWFGFEVTSLIVACATEWG